MLELPDTTSGEYVGSRIRLRFDILGNECDICGGLRFLRRVLGRERRSLSFTSLKHCGFLGRHCDGIDDDGDN